MALTKVFGDDFNADHSGSYTFASFSQPAPFRLNSGHLLLKATAGTFSGEEWAVGPTGVSVSGSGVAVVKFFLDAAARLDNQTAITQYWGCDSPELVAFSGGSWLKATGLSGELDALQIQAFDGASVHSEATVTVGSGDFTGWLVSKRNGGTVTTELWNTDPGGGGSALGSVSHAETTADPAQTCPVEWLSAHDNPYLDYWNLYSGTGTIPVQETSGTPVPTRSLLGVGT